MGLGGKHYNSVWIQELFVKCSNLVNIYVGNLVQIKKIKKNK